MGSGAILDNEIEKIVSKEQDKIIAGNEYSDNHDDSVEAFEVLSAGNLDPRPGSW